MACLSKKIYAYRWKRLNFRNTSIKITDQYETKKNQVIRDIYEIPGIDVATQ
jgi:hypothetical protein